MAIFLASDWFSLLLTGNATADHLVAKGSQAQGTGSHVIWDGKPLTSREKGSRAQGPLTISSSESKVQLEDYG